MARATRASWSPIPLRDWPIHKRRKALTASGPADVLPDRTEEARTPGLGAAWGRKVDELAVLVFVRLWVHVGLAVLPVDGYRFEAGLFQQPTQGFLRVVALEVAVAHASP